MSPSATMRAFVGVGANLGDPRVQVESGIAALRTVPDTEVIAQSSVYASKPVDASGPDFINAVVALDTALPAIELLRALQAIEYRHGRVRSTPNAPRTLDLDLLVYGAMRSDDPVLTLPHPRLHQRAFVLRPLLEIAPQVEAPGLGPLAAWLPHVQDQAMALLPPQGTPR
jgi:2-amino-4-hydroxy-6-hydroxymethyldihydropteridine diphosphokinase